MRYQRALAIANRHQQLLALIRTGEYSSPLLAQTLGVSEPTVYRDIEFLKEQGYAIHSQKRCPPLGLPLDQDARRGRRLAPGTPLMTRHQKRAAA